MIESNMERYCGLCEERLNYKDFIELNDKFSLKKLDKLWNNEEIIILCCYCIWKISDLFNEANLESIDNSLIKIYYNRLTPGYAGIRYHTKIVNKKNLENILEMIFD